MTRWRIILGLVLILALLAACGGGDKDSESGDSSGDGAAPVSNETPGAAFNASGVHVASGRSQPAPEADPEVFEAPFSVGDFIRQTQRGNPAATAIGGYLATYSNNQSTIVLRVFYFNTNAEAMENVRYNLEDADVNLHPVREPYYSERRSFGISRDRHGNYTAAWNNLRWMFSARVDGDLDALNAFLELFAY